MMTSTIRIQGRAYLLVIHILDRLRAGMTVTDIAREFNCTRAWIYLLLKSAEIDPCDFRWYRMGKMTPATRAVATLFASKHLKVRAAGRTRLRIIEPGRLPINVAVHTASTPRATVPNARTLYYHLNNKRKGVVHVVPLDWATLVIPKDAPGYINLPDKPNSPYKWHYIPIAPLSDIELLDVLRENVRV